MGEYVEDNLHAEEAVLAEGIAAADGVVVVPGDVHGAEGADGESLGTTATRGFLWANVGILTRYASALVLAAVLARSLGDAEYRVMVVLTTIILYLDTALDLGMGAALVFEQEKGVSRRVQVAFTANVALACALAVAMVFLAPVIAAFFDLDAYVNVFRALGAVVLISGLTTVPWALFTREMAFRPRAVTEVARDGTRFAVTIALVAAGGGAWAVLWGFLAAKVVWWLLTWWNMRFRPRLAWDRQIFGELYTYAWRHAGNSFLGLLALSGDYFVVGNRIPTQLDTYYQAFRLPEFFLGGQLNAMSAVLFPMYSRIRSEGPEALRQAMYKALRLVALFSIPAGVGLALIGRDSFGLMFGTYSETGIATMQLLAVTGCVVGLGFATGDLLFAIGRPGVLMRINLVMVPVMLSAMWIVGPRGIVWIAVVHLCTATVFTFVRQVVVNRIIGASMLRALASVVPGAVVAACIVAAGLPVRLVTDPGFGSLVLITLAGCVGGLVGLAISPPARAELTDLVAKLRGR